jgi:hypothetical protein
VSSWKDDEHIQEWYQRRKEKERELAKMKIRRAHKDLNWVMERRTAQIANFRRDRKNEEKALKATEVKEHAHSVGLHNLNAVDPILLSSPLSLLSSPPFSSPLLSSFSPLSSLCSLLSSPLETAWLHNP